jgi:phospholipid/cholesterol/gamma-HCH transport system permease protein
MSRAATIREEIALLRRVAVRTVLGALAPRRRSPEFTAEVVKHMHNVGNRSLLFIAVTLGFIGMVLVFQTCMQISRITGDLSQVGGEFIKILIHEFGPSLTAMMLATRVGAGIAAEVGTMMVTEQVDALRMCGVEPIDYLIVPRFIASVVMTAALTCFGVLLAITMGALTAGVSFHVNPHIFLDVSRVSWGDLATGGMKVIAYGAAIPIVSGHAGLCAHGGSEGVGSATTRAVIASSFTVIVLDFVLSGIGLAFFQGKP